LRVALDEPADVQAVDVGQLARQQHQVGGVLAHQRERGLPVGRLQHGELGAVQDAALDIARPLAALDIEHQRATYRMKRRRGVHG